MNEGSVRPKTCESSWIRFLRDNRLAFILWVLAGLHLIISFFAIEPGYLSIDEGIYHWTIKNFAESGSLYIWNGYEQTPSPELTHQFLKISHGQLVSQYPYLFPVIAAPFYKLWKFSGVYLVNVLAFLGALYLTYETAMRLFEDKETAFGSCILLIFATFAWEYSQTAWPHTLTMFFTMAAFYLFVRSYWAPSLRLKIVFAFLAGLMAGAAPGIRMDGFLVFPAILVGFGFARPWRPLEAFAAGVGAVPGLFFLALTNYYKFGVFNPFSYGAAGSGATIHMPVGFAVAWTIIFAVLWIATRQRMLPTIQRHRGPAIVLLIFTATVLMTFPAVRHPFVRLLNGMYMMVVDLRILDPDILEPSLARTSGGALVYIGMLKTSLLQSMPYLPVIMIAFFAIATKSRDRQALILLFLVPLFFLLFLSYGVTPEVMNRTGAETPPSHGGLCLNLRYFVPALPFLTILCAYSITTLLRIHGLPFSSWALGVVGLGTIALYYALTTFLMPTLNQMEFPIVVIPLIATAVLTALLLIILFVRGSTDAGKPLVGSFWIIVMFCVTWAGMTALYYDYPGHKLQRSANYHMSLTTAGVIKSNSIFFTYPYIDGFLGLIGKDHVRLAFPGMDKFQDFSRLVKIYTENGGNVYGAFPRAVWKQLVDGPLGNYRIRPLMQNQAIVIGEITSK